jgi:hypothetical protein
MRDERREENKFATSLVFMEGAAASRVRNQSLL